MKVISNQGVIYYFSPDNIPIEHVNLEEEFWVETKDCYSGQIRSERDLRPNIDISIMNAAVGPIAINGVRAGETICISILEIQLASKGIMVTSPGLGPLGDLITNADTKIISIKDGYAYFSSEIKVPVKPMVGVIGVAPSQGRVHCAVPGNHGGNMDTRDICPGSKVYLPVLVDGANIAISDLHAAMGDGELSGTGIEIAGKTRLKVSKAQPLSIPAPIIETQEHFMVVASDKTFSEAVRQGLLWAVRLIERSLSVNFQDAYRLLSASSDLKISQIVNEFLTVRVAIPKTLISRLI